MSLVYRFRTYALILVAAFLATTGCSKLGIGDDGGRTDESKKAIEGFQATRSAVTNAQKQVDETMASSNQLAAGFELPKTFKKFSSEVDDLDAAGVNARKRAESMRANYQMYVLKWQAEMENMSDPAIKAGLAERQKSVKANFDKVRAAAQEARTAYDPYLATVKNIRQALSVDLSQGALTALKPAFENANTQGKTLKTKLAALQAELDAMLAGSGTAMPPQ
jgi:hypothetical protein